MSTLNDRLLRNIFIAASFTLGGCHRKNVFSYLLGVDAILPEFSSIELDMSLTSVKFDFE